MVDLIASNGLDYLGLPPEANRSPEDLQHVDFFLINLEGYSIKDFIAYDKVINSKFSINVIGNEHYKFVVYIV